MSALQNEPKGARWASFGFALAVFGLLPSEIGYQDIAALIARQPGVTQRWQKHALASPFGTIHAATFSFPRPIGSSIPRVPGVRLASRRDEGGDVTGSISRNPLGNVIRRPEPHEFPVVDPPHPARTTVKIMMAAQNRYINSFSDVSYVRRRGHADAHNYN